MNKLWLCLILCVSALAQQPAASSNVMIAAVSRDRSVLTGGIGSSDMLKPGKLEVEPLAWLTPTGEWRAISCHAEKQAGCRKFEKDYLSKRHNYTVVSADGRGATVHAAPTTLSECFGFDGDGTYSGGIIHDTAVAAGSPDIFTDGPAAKRIVGQELKSVRAAAARALHEKLNAVDDLRTYSVQLEGKNFVVLQGAFQDYANTDSGPGHGKLIFAIGTIREGKFHLLHWKKDIEDENELLLGTIHLKNGRDFLITSVNDPEGQWFRIYGIKDGQLKLIFSGGGSSC